MAKGFNYEDDHDWDDDIDYAAQGMVYWYGKYYPKEYIDSLFKDSSSEEKADDVTGALAWVIGMGALAVIAGSIYGIKKAVPYLKFRWIEHKNRKLEKENGNTLDEKRPRSEWLDIEMKRDRDAEEDYWKVVSVAHGEM